jgi:hypothetical protein
VDIQISIDAHKPGRHESTVVAELILNRSEVVVPELMI